MDQILPTSPVNHPTRHLGWKITGWSFTLVFTVVGIWLMTSGGQDTENGGLGCLLLALLFFVLPFVPPWVQREQHSGRRLLWAASPIFLILALPLALVIYQLAFLLFSLITIAFHLK